jgi:outer membrane biosynthesis protein TonB
MSEHLVEQIEATTEKMDAAHAEHERVVRQLAEADAHCAEFAEQRGRYDQLGQAMASVRRLHDEGIADLFWGDGSQATEGLARLNAVEALIGTFEAQFDQALAARAEVAARLDARQADLDFLADDLYDLQQEQESRQLEWVVERDADELPRLAQIMPWMRGFEEDKQYHRALAGSLAASLLLGLIIPLIDIPLPERDEIIEVPDRLVKFIQKPERKPLPPPREIIEPVVEPEPVPPKVQPEPIPEPTEVKPKVVEEPAPAVKKQKSAKERVATKGLLAFRESLSDLAQKRPSARLGANAQLNNSGSTANARPSRDMIATATSGSSGGINLAAISRDVGGGGGDMAGVATTQVASSIAGAGGVDRPLSTGGVAGRTDEEIQIVFDRYKAALYRLYNRELRIDPTLRGQMVLQLTIEPDGSVSVCRLQGSDMDAPNLADQVVQRVRGFDFGAKDVPAVTIIYPIDFLPTA